MNLYLQFLWFIKGNNLFACVASFLLVLPSFARKCMRVPENQAASLLCGADRELWYRLRPNGRRRFTQALLSVALSTVSQWLRTDPLATYNGPSSKNEVQWVVYQSQGM